MWKTSGIWLAGLAIAAGDLSEKPHPRLWLPQGSEARLLEKLKGDPLAASLETKELSFDNHYADTNACLPLVDGADTVHVMFGRRSRQTEDVNYSNQIGLNRIGEACKVVSAKFQRFRLEITGGFDYAKGVEIRGRQAGRR